MPLMIASKRVTLAALTKQYGDATILDVTSRGPQPWVKFSPFYPHGNIPVPLSPGCVAASVEGIWQGLKVFDNADVDLATFAITGMSGIKRTVRRYGAVRGHRAGIHGTTLLSYREARYQIYLPAYRWVLDHCVQAELERLRTMSAAHTVVLLDYETNTDVENTSKPLSHAALIVKYVQDAWPTKH